MFSDFDIDVRTISFCICSEDINHELSRIATSITFDNPRKSVVKADQRCEPTSITEQIESHLTGGTKKLSLELQDEVTELGKASHKSVQKGRRRTEPLKVTRQSEPQSTGLANNVQAEVEMPTEARRKSVRNERRRSEPPPQVTEPAESSRRPVDSNKLSRKKLTPYEEFEKDLMTYGMQSYPKKKLFHGIRHGNICKVCCSTDDHNDQNLVKCSACGGHVHSTCLTNNNNDSYVHIEEQQLETEQRRPTIKIRVEPKLLCNECSSPPNCYVCKDETVMQLERCNESGCARYYHLNCLDNWKQMAFVDSKLKCPLHVCQTCFSTNSDRTTTKLSFCMKCPTAYHIDSSCIPAGTRLLTQSQHICVRHRVESRRTLPSLDWCFRCGEEGEHNIIRSLNE